MSANRAQAEAWNGTEAAHWVDHADRYDRQLAPFGDALLARVEMEKHHAVLDVGCGCGRTTLAAARRARAALGVDLSEPLLAIAADRARSAAVANAEFVVTDAQTHEFGDGAFDVAISQFGLMFFDDPTSAFDNLGRALGPGGRAAFVCWQGLEANEWVSVVGDAVARRGELPALGGLAGGPGMFALKDPGEIAMLLTATGFTRVEIDAIAPSVLLGGGGSLDESFEFLLGMGIVRGLLGHVDPAARDEAVEEIRGSLAARYEPGVGVRLGSGAWLVSARS